MEDPADPNITQTLETIEVAAKINATSIKMNFNSDPNIAIIPTQPCGEKHKDINKLKRNPERLLPKAGRKVLTKAGRKVLNRRLAEGVEYEEAFQSALERTAKSRAGQMKSILKNDTVKQTKAENTYLNFIRSCNRPSPEEVSIEVNKKNSDGIDVGIIHSLDPQTVINPTEMKLLRTSIMDKIFTCEDDDSQVRFLECIDKPGWLLIKCADEESVAWLTKQVPLLKPWEGADLKLVQGEELPKIYLCQVYIPDPPTGERPEVDQILAGFKRMNRDLLIEAWTVVHQEFSDSGRIWIFSLCRKCMSQLIALDMMPYFGFGRVKFTIIKR